MNYYRNSIRVTRMASTAIVTALTLGLMTACWNQEKTEEVVPITTPDGSSSVTAPLQERTTNDTDPDTGKYFVRPAPMLSLQFGPKWKTQGQENPQEEEKMLRMPNGILYRDILVGYGMSPNLRATVLVHYIAYNSDGSIFDSSVDRGMPLVFTLGDHQVMAGLQGGLLNMQVGGVRKVIVPSKFCIGKLGKKNVPKLNKMTMMLRLLSVDQNYESSPPREDPSQTDAARDEFFKKEYEKQGIDTRGMDPKNWKFDPQ